MPCSLNDLRDPLVLESRRCRRVQLVVWLLLLTSAEGRLRGRAAMLRPGTLGGSVEQDEVLLGREEVVACLLLL